MTMSDFWLRCFVLKGMFSDERAVRYGNISFFAPKDLVEGDIDQEGKVRVRSYRVDHRSWVVLPTEDQKVIPVDERDLIPA
jgi:hypothetical protein